jgi:hypothetical protein
VPQSRLSLFYIPIGTCFACQLSIITVLARIPGPVNSIHRAVVHHLHFLLNSSGHAYVFCTLAINIITQILFLYVRNNMYNNNNNHEGVGLRFVVMVFIELWFTMSIFSRTLLNGGILHPLNLAVCTLVYCNFSKLLHMWCTLTWLFCTQGNFSYLYPLVKITSCLDLHLVL